MSKNKWGALSMRDRAFLIREAVRNGITNIDSIRDTWEHRFDGLRDVVEKVNTSDKDFARRLRQEGRTSIPDWEDPRRIATHKLGVATDENGIHYIFPSVQNINGQLVDFTNPKTEGHGYDGIIAAERGDTIQIGNTNRDLRNAIKFTEKYKKLGIYPEFSEPPHTFDGESSQPTEDEYIAQRAKDRIQEALIHARNRKETIQPYIKKSQKYKEDELEKLQMFESELDRLYKKADLTSKMNLSYDEFGVPKITKVIDPKIQERIHQVQDYVNKYKLECSKSYTHDPGCLATVMDDYRKTETWNERFSKNPRTMGFVEINDSDILPGDIVQFGSSYQDFQTGESGIDFNHAMMANTPYNKDISKMRYNGSNGADEIRINSKYPSHWEETVGYRFVGDKADSLQWKKEYRERYGHQFSGKENNKIQTDTEHKTDNSLIERIALNIGSKEAAKDAGHASIRDIVTGTIDALMGKRPTNNNNLAAFLGKPEDYGFEELTDNRGPQFNDIISQYENQNIKTYKGVINPFNEYVVSQEDYDKFLELAKTGDTFYGNADWDNVKYFYDIIDSRNTTTTSAPLHEGYRDDVKNYPIQFYTKNGKLFANAADFYDFNTDSFQGKILTKKGNPYILRQNDIPVRAIYVPEEFKDLNILPYDAEGLTDDVRRAINMRETVRIRENQEKSNKNKK